MINKKVLPFQLLQTANDRTYLFLFYYNQGEAFRNSAFCILHSAFKRVAFPLIPNYALRIPNYNFSTISLVSLAIASSSFVGTTNALTGQPGNVSSTSSP